MKALTVFYSRTGFTKKAAQEVAKALRSDLEEITDPASRAGLIGYLKSGREAVARKLPLINSQKKDPSKYDIVVLCTPVWAGRMASPVRTYISQNRGKLKKVAFFATQGSASEQRVFSDMETTLGKPPISSLYLTAKEVAEGNYTAKVREFASRLRK
ncbi:MAG: flavodoxin [archaeon]